MSETDLKRAVVDTLRRLGIEAWSNPSGQVRKAGRTIHMAPAGTPDIIGYLPGGRMLAIEVKVPGKEKRNTSVARRQLQAAWRERAAKAGCLAFVATSSAEAVATVVAATKAVRS